MSYECIIVDDDAFAVEKLAAVITAIPGFIIRNVYTDPLTAMSDINAGLPVDGIFLDVEMAGINGIELAMNINGKATKIIFVTAYAAYGYSAFEAGADAFILKPFRLEKVSKVLLRLFPVKKDFFLIKQQKDLQIRRLKYNDVYAVKSDQGHLTILLEKESICIRLTLKEISSELRLENGFMRINKREIIALHHIESVRINSIKLSNGCEFTISEHFIGPFREFINGRIIVGHVDN